MPSPQWLAEGNYLKQAQNILITGATGCGKSFIACALGHQACLQGYKTSYLNINRLIEKITLAKLDGSYLKMLNQLEKQQLIILEIPSMGRNGYPHLKHTMGLSPSCRRPQLSSRLTCSANLGVTILQCQSMGHVNRNLACRYG